MPEGLYLSGYKVYQFGLIVISVVLRREEHNRNNHDNTVNFESEKPSQTATYMCALSASSIAACQESVTVAKALDHLLTLIACLRV